MEIVKMVWFLTENNPYFFFDYEFLILDVSEISCDFENDFLCGYTNKGNYNIKWTRYTGLPQTSETGPSDGMLIYN